MDTRNTLLVIPTGEFLIDFDLDGEACKLLHTTEPMQATVYTPGEANSLIRYFSERHNLAFTKQPFISISNTILCNTSDLKNH